ncbi:COG3650 family protein [Nostoc sp. MG11]|uniref:COG3650 family protein n=1 Tax=Nostoc sp. MG11 TaxID=2721166 RepID=UPI0018667F16|nr:hypothetical protein [Nostoc sp. MG11]
MKTFISCVVLLGLDTTLLISNPSTAKSDISSINKNTLVVAETVSNEEFIARGTEPFWSVTVSKRGIIHSSPDTKKQTFPYVVPLEAEGRPIDLVRVYPLRGNSNNLLIIKKVNVCSDGMSDKNYSYSATFILENKIFEGCAEKK